MHAWLNGANERRTREIIAEMASGTFVSISSEVLPEIKEYERTSTTVINAYVQPVVTRYARAMADDLREIGVPAPVMVMQSSGGMMPIDSACEFPKVPGPAIIEEDNSLTVVLPGWTARLDDWSNIVLERARKGE